MNAPEIKVDERHRFVLSRPKSKKDPGLLGLLPKHEKGAKKKEQPKNAIMRIQKKEEHVAQEDQLI